MEFNTSDTSFLKMMSAVNDSSDKFSAYQKGYSDAIINTLNVVVDDMNELFTTQDDIITYSELKNLIESYKTTTDKIKDIYSN